VYNYGATYAYDAIGKRTEIYDPVLGGTYEYFNGATRDSYKGGTHWSIDGGVFTYEVGSYDYGVYFGRSDHLGTPKITTNTSGTVIKTESMGPFGDGFTATGASISDIGFAGGDYDRSGDSNNFGARDYKPIEGRWLSPDPAGLAAVNPSNPQTWNRYAYVGNDPVDYIDPSGLVRTPWGIFGGNISSGWDEFDLLGIPAVGPGSVVEDGGCFGCGTGFDLFGSTDGGSDASMPPENETQPPQTTACTTTILSAVNSQFGTNATPANVINTSSSGQGAGGQATNLQILLAGLPAGQFNSIQPGRYPLSPLTWLTGYGPTLHVTGQTPFDPTASFSNSNVGGITSVNFTAHIDSAFAYNPFGALFHLFIDFLHIGGPRKPC
jgi:RHS repeat-associated protein